MQVMRNYGPSGGVQHKWTRSNEGFRIESSRSTDEDLALFHDMRTREDKNFLHPSTDDIEASLPTKLGGLTGFRISASQTPPWKGNDLLATDSEKNDYDWLLTPPGTPLFPSLDKDSLQTYMDHNIVTQPYSASKVSRLSGSNTTEPHHKMSRRSPGPRTPPSTASSTSSTNTFSRGRAPSPSRVNSSPTLRPATPTKTLARSSTTLSRASTRSSPPILRRTNTSPTVRSSSTERSMPPLKGRTRGASVSPKLQAWQAPELGFSDEPPPNLRTSLADRPLSSSRNMTSRPRPGAHVEGRHSYSEAFDSRQSHWRNSSSSASKVSSSTTSQDRWSSRGSIISSSDDGTDVMEPTFLDFSVTSPSSTSGTTKTVAGRFENEVSSKYNPVVSRQRRSTDTLETTGLSSASARKSLESSMQRVDHRRITQNMFRPLLSSAPTTSFYNIGHTIIRHQPSSPFVEHSITASSNASSERGVRIFPGNESSDEGEGEVEIAWDNSMPPGPAMSKSELNANDAIDEEYNTVHDHADQYEQESVADNTSCPADVIVSCEAERTMYIDNLDWPAHEACTERNGTTCDATSQCEDKHSFVPKSLVTEVNYGTVDEDVVHLNTQQVNADQEFVDIPEDISMQRTDTPWLCCDLVDPHESLYGPDKPVVSTHDASPNSHETYRSKQGLQEAICKPRTEIVRSPPQRDISIQDCFDSKQSLQSRIHGMDHPVVESITNVSMSATVACQEEYNARFLSEKMVNLPMPAQPAYLMEGADFSDRGQLEVAVLPKSSMQEITGSPAMDVLSSERPHVVMENTFLCSTDINGGVPSPTTSEREEQGRTMRPHGHELQEDLSSSSSTPTAQKQEGFLHQSELASEDSCREYYIDMPETKENVITSRGPRNSSFKTPKNQLYFDNESDVGLEMSSGVNDMDYSQVHGNIHAINFDNEVDEQLTKVLSHSDDIHTPLSRLEENSSYCNALVNGLPLPLEASNTQLDVNTHCTADLNPSIDMDESSGSCMAREASAEVLNEYHELDQTELPKSPGNESTKSLVSSDTTPQSSDEMQLHSSSELLSEQKNSNKVILPENNVRGKGDEDILAQTEASPAAECQQQPHLTEYPSKIHASPGWKPATPTFSMEEATNTILFCNSIVHDMVYKATSIATEKEAVAMAAAAPLSSQVKGQLSNADFISSLRGKVSKSGTWKGRKKEGKSALKTSQRDDSTKATPITITQHPTPIDGMEKGPAKVEAEKVPPDIAKEKGFMGLSVNSNCQCRVM
eukprot:c23911_g1_i1 orf=1211-4999(+)